MVRAPIRKSQGVTPAERYLGTLCEKTFLSLWSYPGVFRDQRAGARTEGKEVCDLLVVFGDDVLIFADKHCAYPNSGDFERDWRRWFKRAVRGGADQVWGAERWIRDFPDRLFIDRACSQPFPYELPATPRFHLIVVAHDVSRACSSALGGSGSLMLRTDLNGLDAYGAVHDWGSVARTNFRACAR
jgi:hypothetical protein